MLKRNIDTVHGELFTGIQPAMVGSLTDSGCLQFDVSSCEAGH